MMKRLLVPLEGDDSAETLLPLLRRLDALGVGEMTLLRAEMPVAVDEYAVVSEALLGEARVFLERTRQALGNLKARVQTLARIGPAVTTALEVVDEIDATLLVAALPRRTRFQRFLFGSVPERLIQRSRVPVLAVPPPWNYELAPAPEDRTPRSILVPLDGGRASREILPTALEVARSARAKLLLATVIPSRHPVADEFEAAEDLLYTAGVECASAGVECSVIIESGDPVERILALCKDRAVDWVAMSTRGKSGLSRWISPSATLQMLRRTWLPVLSLRAQPAARPVGLGAPSVLGRQ